MYFNDILFKMMLDLEREERELKLQHSLRYDYNLPPVKKPSKQSLGQKLKVLLSNF